MLETASPQCESTGDFLRECSPYTIQRYAYGMREILRPIFGNSAVNWQKIGEGDPDAIASLRSLLIENRQHVATWIREVGD